jgi:hypothetical protein
MDHTWNVRLSRHGWYPNGFRMPLTGKETVSDVKESGSSEGKGVAPFHVVIRSGILASSLS